MLLWGQRKAILDDPNSFVELSGFGKLACEFLESRQMRWASRSGAPQLLNPIS
jgi:hypothetical protein